MVEAVPLIASKQRRKERDKPIKESESRQSQEEEFDNGSSGDEERERTEDIKIKNIEEMIEEATGKPDKGEFL